MRNRSSSRRSFVKLLAAAPLLSQIAARDLYAQAATAIGKDPRQNVYTLVIRQDSVEGRKVRNSLAQRSGRDAY